MQTAHHIYHLCNYEINSAKMNHLTSHFHYYCNDRNNTLSVANMYLLKKTAVKQLITKKHDKLLKCPCLAEIQQ